MEDADYELKSEMQEAKVIRRELTQNPNIT